MDFLLLLMDLLKYSRLIWVKETWIRSDKWTVFHIIIIPFPSSGNGNISVISIIVYYLYYYQVCTSENYNSLKKKKKATLLANQPAAQITGCKTQWVNMPQTWTQSVCTSYYLWMGGFTHSSRGWESGHYSFRKFKSCRCLLTDNRRQDPGRAVFWAKE